MTMDAMEKNIYIVLTGNNTWFSKMIKCFTKAPLNHASVAFDGRLNEVYSFGRKSLRNPLNAGLVQENYNDPFYTETECAVYRCRISKGDYDRIAGHIADMMRNQHRYKYNLLGLVGVLLNKKIGRKDAYFCSQFVASVFEHVGSPLTDKPSYLTTPCDISASSSLQEIYRGSVSEFLKGADSTARTEPAELTAQTAIALT